MTTLRANLISAAQSDPTAFRHELLALMTPEERKYTRNLLSPKRIREFYTWHKPTILGWRIEAFAAAFRFSLS